MGVREQIIANSQYIGKNYGSEKFIAYFQNYSNTYLPVKKLEEYILEACMEDIVAIYISTRPDCISYECASMLKKIKEDNNIDIVVELGLQTVNYKSLKIMNRGHSLAEFIDAANALNSEDVGVCAHYIVDFPTDDIEDVIEGAKILSALRISQVKCHSLYILKDTVLDEMYQNGKIKPITANEYIERIVTFLEYLNPEIVIQRLMGRAPQERTSFCNWGLSWWKLRDMIEEKMRMEYRFQGKKFNYLNGSACIKL
jgi:radical SAM protein (TIGR01212 family)